ncbi:MAG TPA: methylmalonyl Co-A mutase-associated GTPase MeaB [Blastocatellia bacterium]|nr:methylmalonyl Co-A mutase-associated GTPase MeaB [Blastocatellia bacterium]
MDISIPITDGFPLETQVEKILARDPRAVARAISRIENDTPDAPEILKALFRRTAEREAHGLIIGLTGAPGAGKSSLVDKLALHYRALDKTVGIVAVDPSSPFSGGALLGDRIRMQALATDPDVFIRSMATRGNLGGLARATVDAVAVLEAAGYDRVLVETVGVGQDEVDVVKAADVSVVVLVPGMGDDIQAIKAGIMEIGDIFVINKAEREGVERAERELVMLLEMTTRPDGWHPPIVRTVATENRGIDRFAEAVERYAAFRQQNQASFERRQAVAESRIVELLRERLVRLALSESPGGTSLQAMAAEVASRQRDPYTVVEEIIGKMKTRQNAASAAESATDNHTAEVGTKVGHLGVAVSSIDEALNFWRDGLGLELKEIEVVEDQGVRVAMLPIGESRIELLEATGGETPVGRFLAKRGPGLHHVCVEVADLTAHLARLKARGVRLIDEQPRPGAGGHLVAFIHPASTGGVLVELTEKKQ